MYEELRIWIVEQKCLETLREERYWQCRSGGPVVTKSRLIDPCTGRAARGQGRAGPPTVAVGPPRPVLLKCQTQNIFSVPKFHIVGMRNFRNNFIMMRSVKLLNFALRNVTYHMLQYSLLTACCYCTVQCESKNPPPPEDWGFLTFTRTLANF